MKDKPQIVKDWLPRYTGVPLDQFGEYILLTNFTSYLGHFARLTGADVVGPDRPMPTATADGITMINFGMGSPNAATVMDLLSAIMPKAVLLLGKCGGLKRKNQLGDLVLPIAAIRLLDRHGLHDQPPRVGARRGLQGTPARDALHGDRHGNGNGVRGGLRESHSERRVVARERPADGARRREDRSVGCAGDRGIRRAPHPDRHRSVAVDPSPRHERAAPAVRRMSADEAMDREHAEPRR